MAAPLPAIKKNPKMLLDNYNVNHACSWTTYSFILSSKFLRSRAAAYNLKQPKNALGQLLITFEMSWTTEIYCRERASMAAKLILTTPTMREVWEKKNLLKRVCAMYEKHIKMETSIKTKE